MYESVIVIVADGARPDTLADAIAGGELPTLASLHSYTITSTFPSVTGPAYTPFLMGRYPAPIGLPGLRWYDRSRTRCSWPGYARSYVGHEMRHVDGDLDSSTPTMFELTRRSLGALNVISRGLSKKNRIGRGFKFALRTAATHFRGNVRGWLDIDRDVGNILARRIREENPEFVFAALTGIDKTSHARGHDSQIVREAMQIVDGTVAQIRNDAEKDGRWDHMHVWVVSDHGHSPVRRHEDLARLIRSLGYRTMAHPWAFDPMAEVAVMVSGNAMAHVYVDVQSRERKYWPDLQKSWNSIADTLMSRESVDLLLLPDSSNSCLVRHIIRGDGLVEWSKGKYSYKPLNGDPLQIGEIKSLSANESYDAIINSDYPDALVQIANIASAPRSGDIILSAARNWDFRARHEPIPHVSSHGALHREHMVVPLLSSHPLPKIPRRTVDVMPSAVAALGIPLSRPLHLDGESYII